MVRTEHSAKVEHAVTHEERHREDLDCDDRLVIDEERSLEVWLDEDDGFDLVPNVPRTANAMLRLPITASQ